MFNKIIIKQVLENLLICEKEDMFKYVNLNDNSIDLFASEYLEEDIDRVFNVRKDDVFTFLNRKLADIGYVPSVENVYLSTDNFLSREQFLKHFNDWLRENPHSTYLIPTCHRTNLEILERISTLFQYKLDKLILIRLSDDLRSVSTDANYKNYAREYEYFILPLLRECTNGYVFSNILESSNNNELKKEIYEMIDISPNRGSISIEVVTNLGAENVPPSILQHYIEFVNPSTVSLDIFLSILNTVPLTNFTLLDSDTSNPVFTKYVSLIQNYIKANLVSKELISKMIQASSPDTPNGWTILNLLNQACASFALKTGNINNHEPKMQLPIAPLDQGGSQTMPITPLDQGSNQAIPIVPAETPIKIEAPISLVDKSIDTHSEISYSQDFNNNSLIETTYREAETEEGIYREDISCHNNQNNEHDSGGFLPQNTFSQLI